MKSTEDFLLEYRPMKEIQKILNQWKHKYLLSIIELTYNAEDDHVFLCVIREKK